MATPGHTAVRERTDPVSRIGRATLIAISLLFLVLILIVPVASVLGYAFSRGLDVYVHSLRERDTFAAIRLNLNVLVAVVGNYDVLHFRLLGWGLLSRWEAARCG